MEVMALGDGFVAQVMQDGSPIASKSFKRCVSKEAWNCRGESLLREVRFALSGAVSLAYSSYISDIDVLPLADVRKKIEVAETVNEILSAADGTPFELRIIDAELYWRE